MRDKSDIFIRSKEGNLEQNLLINDLRFRLENLQIELEQSIRNVDKYMYSNEKYRLENKNLKTEIGLYKKNNNSATALKLNRENGDLRIENKKLKEKLSQIEQDDEKRLSQLRVNSNAITSDLEDKVNELTEELESVQTDDVLKQKLEYWKEKSKAETARIENLEKQIIAHADRNTLNKIFG